jgi:hypothetical protein
MRSKSLLAEYTSAQVDPRLPLVDLHLHQERSARLNQVLAARGLQAPIDWAAWTARLREDTPSGIARLRELWANLPTSFDHDTPDVTLLRFRALLQEAAAAGAVLAEVRIGNETILRPGLIDLFREAEEQVRATYPDFRGALVALLKLWQGPSEMEAALNVCLQAGSGGPGGVVKRGFIWRAFAGLSGGIEAARNAFANRHNSVTCTYTF